MKLLRFFSAVLLLAAGARAHALPKYGPSVAPLSARTNVEYFQKNPAADYWALSPYYIHQETPTACSAANIVMLLNAARVGTPLGSDEELITFKNFLERFADKGYRRAVTSMTAAMAIGSHQLANRNLARILLDAARKLKIKDGNPSVEFIPLDQKDLPAGKKRFIRDLEENERSANDFIFFSFMQDKVTGDPDGDSHVGTVAAFDAEKRLVLVLDTDRKFYEPYWTPVDTLFAAISDPASDGRREAGWIRFKVR